MSTNNADCSTFGSNRRNEDVAGLHLLPFFDQDLSNDPAFEVLERALAAGYRHLALRDGT